MTDQPVNKVSVTDLDMPFLSMVRFMVKWAIAAIPALLILMILGAVFWALLLGFFAGVGSRLSHKSTDTTSSATSPGAKASLAGNKAESTGSAESAAATAYISNVVVKNVHVSKSDLGETGVFGEIKNGGDRTLKEVEITVYCLGEDGKPVFEKQYHPVLVTEFGYGETNQPLKPGYSRQFGVKVDDAPSDWNRKVDVKVTSVAFQ